MSEYAPLRDAFHDMNKMLLDKQQWDQKFELDKENQGIQRMQVESQLQDAALKRTDLERKAMLDKDAMQLVPVNIYDNVPRSAYSDRIIFDESDAAQRYAEALMPEYKGGISVDRASGLVRDANGEVFRIPKAVAATRAAGAYGIISQKFDPITMINENLSKVDAKVSEFETKLKKIPITDVASRKMVLEQIAEAKKTRKEHMNLLDNPDALIPFYQKKVEILDSMALSAAAGGADLALIQQLQHGSQRAVTDLQHIRAESTRKSEGALNRQARREDKEITLEAARIRAGGGASEKSQQHYIQELDKEGVPIPGTRKVYNAPRTAGAAISPPTNHIFVDELDSDAKARKDAQTAEGNVPDSVVVGINKDNWLSSVTDPISGTKSDVLPADRPRVAASQIVIGRDYNLLDPKTGKRYNPFTMATNAQMEVINAEKAFWEDYDRLAAQMAAKRGVKDLTKDEKDFLINRMANEKDGFISDYKYTPKLEHRKSLDRALPGVIGRAEREK